MCFLTLVVETVNSVDAGRLMVSPQEEEVFGVEDLVCKKQADGFKRVLAAVHIVSEEEIVVRGREAPDILRASVVASVHNLEEPQQVAVLTVDVTCHHFITADHNYITTDFGLSHIRITDSTVYFRVGVLLL
jgi:hypothetical protein